MTYITDVASNRERRYPQFIGLGLALGILAVDFNIQLNQEVERGFLSVNRNNTAPIPPRQKMRVVERCSVHIFRENGDHIFVRITIEVMYFIAPMPYY
jgi:hypothetical protein